MESVLDRARERMRETPQSCERAAIAAEECKRNLGDDQGSVFPFTRYAIGNSDMTTSGPEENPHVPAR